MSNVSNPCFGVVGVLNTLFFFLFQFFSFALSLQVLTKDEQELAARNEYNFDHPDAFDFELLVNVLKKLKKGKSVKVPVYDFTNHSRRKEWVRVWLFLLGCWVGSGANAGVCVI